MFEILKAPKKMIESQFINTYKNRIGICLSETEYTDTNTEIYTILAVASKNKIKEISKYVERLHIIYDINTILISDDIYSL